MERQGKIIVDSGEKIIRDNQMNLLLHIIGKGYDINEVVVIVNLTESPPTIRVKLFQDYCDGKGLEGCEVPSKQMLAAVRYNKESGSVPVIYTGWGHEVRGATLSQITCLPSLTGMYYGIKPMIGNRRGDLTKMPDVMILLSNMFQLQPDDKEANVLEILD